EPLVLAAAQPRDQRGVVLAADRPAAVPEIEARALPHRVLLRGGERGEGADVAPVGALFEFLQARNAVLPEVVGEDPARGAQAGKDVATEVGIAAPARLLEDAFQHLGLEQVVTHRGVGARRVARSRRRALGLLAEVAYAAVAGGGEHAEGRCVLEG